jgi:glycosyltransferase involved in cell wall biosynthesis
VAARRPDVRFQIIGQGDAGAWAIPQNVEILGSMGPERAALLGQARAIIAPSRYIEPFCGSVVEAQLCGTPAITSDFGAFAETVQHGITGFHCQTVGQFTAAVDRVLNLDREKVARRARKLYAMERVGRLYDDAFEVVRQRLADGVFPLGW